MAFEGAELKSLGEVLRKFSFRIPDYQRGYAWQQAQWQAFWDDLCDAHQAQRNHFLGTLMTAQRSFVSGHSLVDVVDGQQRLVTAVIALNRLSAKAGADFERYSILYPGRDTEQAYFQYYALGALGTSADLTGGSSYALNMKSAAEYFDEKIQSLSTAEQALELRDFMLARMRLFVLEVAKDFDIHVAFETLNNRGRPLSAMELLKNRLMYLSSSMRDGEALREEIHKVWKGIYTWLGRSTKTQGHDDEFLLAHTVAYYGAERQADWLRVKLFQEEFSSRNASLSEDTIRSYIHNLERGAGWWARIHDPRDLPAAHQRALKRLEHCGFAYFKPLILASYMRATRGSHVAVTMPGEHVVLLEPVARLLDEVERFIVVVFRLAGGQASKGKADADRCAHALMMPGRGNQLEGEDLDLMTDAEVIEFIANYIEACVDNGPRSEEDEEDDEEFLYPRFRWDGYVWPENVSSAIDERMRSESVTGFYNWDFTRLALFEYEESFRANGKNAEKISWEEFAFDETIEHIYPQTPGENEYWKKQIAIDGRSDKKGRFTKCLMHSLGNLLLLSRSANSKIQAQAFRDSGGEQKIDIYRNASYSATEVSNVFRDWTLEAIAARGVAILKFVEKRWRTQLSDTPEDLDSYLPLCFGTEAFEKIRRRRVRFSRTKFRNLYAKIPPRKFE